MAKFYGPIGFATTTENPANTGVWQEGLVEKSYRGDITRISRREEERENLLPNLTVNHKISIVSDAFADNNIFAMRYVKWMGTLWTITSVEVYRPRLILSIGGVYNGK